MRRRIGFVVAAICGGVLFVHSIRAAGFLKILATLEQVGWGFTIVLLLSGGREVIRTLAWMRTIEDPVRPQFMQALRARLTGEALSTLLPMGVVVGEPTKAAQVGRGIPFATAFRALVVEFAFYSGSLVPLLAAGAIAIAIVKRVSVRPSSLSLGVSAAVAGASFLVARARTPRWSDSHAHPVATMPDQRPNVLARAALECRRLWDAISGFRSRHPERVWPLIALEAACQICAIAEVYVTLALISPLRPTLASALVLETVNRVVTVVFQILPMRVGVDESSAALSAGGLDLGAATGVSLALVRKLRLLFWSTVGIVLLLVPASDRSASLQPVPSSR
jgi:hypothetical protein